MRGVQQRYDNDWDYGYPDRGRLTRSDVDSIVPQSFHPVDIDSLSASSDAPDDSVRELLDR